MNTDATHPINNPLYTDPLLVGNLEIKPIDLLEHVLATGSTGSGKTRSFVLPLVENVLKRFGHEQEQKAGMILIDAKGDMSELAGECIRRAGRSEDLYILGEGGNCWFSIFEPFDGDPTMIADFLHESLEDRMGGKGGDNESFWHENALRLLRAGVITAKALHGNDLGGLGGIAKGLNMIMEAKDNASDDGDNSSCKASSQSKIDREIDGGLINGWISSYEADSIKDYIQNDVIRLCDKTWSTIANMTRNYIAQFSQPALQELFRPALDKRKIIPEDVIDEGIILIVSLSPVIYGSSSTPFRMAIQKAFCDCILLRNHLVRDEGNDIYPINQIRPILYVMDEFHTILSPKGRSADAYFLDRARESRCMCILATQGISAISSVIASESMRDHLLNNTRTKFFFSNDCPETINYFEKIGGRDRQSVSSVRYGKVAAPPRFRLPNHTFSKSPSVTIEGHSIEQRWESRFSSNELGSLPNGSALVVLKGRKLVRYSRDPGLYAISTKANDGSLANPEA